MKTGVSRRQALGLVAATAALSLGQLPLKASAQANNKPPVKLTIRLDWKAGGQHAPFFLGKARGLYAAEGIDLEIITGSGSSDGVKQLGAGSVDMAIVDALVLSQAAEQGVPVKSIGAYYQRTPIVLISPKSKPVTEVRQLLNGVKVGSKRASATYQGLTALLAVNKIDPKRVDLVDIGFGVQPLLVGQVDALMGFTMNETIEAESGGMAVTEMAIADQGVVAYGLMLASSDKFIASKPELTRAFMRATRRAVAASVADTAAAIQAVAASASETDSARETKVLVKTAPYWFVKPGDNASFGTQTMSGWQQTLDTAQLVGLVEKAPAAKDLFVAGLDK
jgi:NitT/TauT family transport system substrate-binding protein